MTSANIYSNYISVNTNNNNNNNLGLKSLTKLQISDTADYLEANKVHKNISRA